MSISHRLAAAGALVITMIGLGGCVSDPYPYRRVYYAPPPPAVVYTPAPGYYRYGYGYGYRRPYW